MPRVVVDGAVPSREGDLEVRINGPDRTFRLRPFRLPRHFTAALGPRIRDVLAIASAVFAADVRVPRGGPSRPDLGAGWYRDFHFIVPVHDSGFWPGMATALAEALEFLTGDHFTFEFVARPAGVATEPVLDLGHDQPQIRADEVVLFSGGLDSLTGALDVLKGEEATVLLVTHQAAPKTMRRQKELYDALRARHPGRVHWIPVRATLVGQDSVESTQRSRSFLYAALGFAAASFVGTNRVRFFENGIVSLNLPIDRQVVGTMATRTTHPLALQRLAELLSLVAIEPLEVSNPYGMRTKTEVLQRLDELEGAELIGKTVSCSGVRRRTVKHPHCGACSQCLDRRFAVLAAGVADHDPAGKYEVDLLLGPRKDLLDRTMAIDWTHHATSLAGLDQQEFRSRFANEIADVLAAHRDRAAWEVVSALYTMHRRHGEAVKRAVTEAIREHAPLLAEGKVSRDALLPAIMLGEDVVGRHSGTLLEGIEPSAVSQSPDQPILPLKLTLSGEERSPVILVWGVGELSGGHVRLVAVLEPYHEESRIAGVPLDAYQYVPTGQLAGHLGTAKTAVWQYARRCRNELDELFMAHGETPPSQDTLLQSRQPRGYRIAPDCRFVERQGGDGPLS